MIKQDWNGNQLDKDVIIPDNKLYSPETCMFVSPQVNSLLNTRDASRGKWPIGVCNVRNRFLAKISLYGKVKHLGHFDNPAQASDAYIIAKIQNIREIAAQQKDQTIRIGLERHADLYEFGHVA